MVKIFLLTKNEALYIEDWIKYHGYLFGYKNLFILDGSDDKHVLEIYKKYIDKGLNVNYSSSGLNDVCQELNKYIHENKGDSSFLIKLDTDEFLAYTEPFLMPNINFLEKFLTRNYLKTKHSYLRQILLEKIFNVKHEKKQVFTHGILKKFEELPVTGQRYKASLTMWSFPSREFVANPCRNLVDFTTLQFTHVKSFFHSASFVSVDLGCHSGMSTNMSGFIDTGLTVVHYHNTSLDDSINRAKQALISHGYIDSNESIYVQKEKLISLRSKGQVASFHKIDLYIEYLQALETGNSVDPESLNQYHPHYKKSRNIKKNSIIKDTLDYIDNNN